MICSIWNSWSNSRRTLSHKVFYCFFLVNSSLKKIGRKFLIFWAKLDLAFLFIQNLSGFYPNSRLSFRKIPFERWAMQKSRHFFRFQKISQFHLLVLMKKIPHFLGKLDLAFLLIPNLSMLDAPSKFKKIDNLVGCASGIFFHYISYSL